MPAAQRLNDENDYPAKIIKVNQSTVFVNNQPLAVNGSEVEDHGMGKHDAAKTANGSQNVFASNTPVNRQGDADTCGHTRKDGSSNVFIN